MESLIKSLVKNVSPEEIAAINARNGGISESLHAVTVIPSSETRGGSPITADLNFLSLLVMRIRPKIIFEFGTWIGTSATVMAAAGAEEIYTCDYREWYKGTDARVKYHNLMSTDMLLAVSKKRPVQFCFVDATLSDIDVEMLLGFFEPGRVAIAVHDAYAKNGSANIARLCGKMVDATILMPELDCLFITSGVPINAETGLVIGNELLQELLS
jgi:hypothetical protein